MQMTHRIGMFRSAAGDHTKSKYRQISDQLLSEIEDGRWRPGDRLPSEEQLAAWSETSLGTVQRALRELAEMGVVERQHGRGTFVAGARAPERHLRHFRFVAEGSGALLPVYFNVIDIRCTDESGPWKLFLAPEDGKFIRIQRLISINQEFEIFSEIYLPEERFGAVADLKPKALSGVSVRDLLAERFNAPTLKTYQTMRCQELPPRVTRLIRIPVGQHGIMWMISGMSYRDVPITWQRVFVPPSDRNIEMSSGDLP